MGFPEKCRKDIKCVSCGGDMLGRYQDTVCVTCVPQPWKANYEVTLFDSHRPCAICGTDLHNREYTCLNLDCIEAIKDDMAPKELECGRPSLTGVLSRYGCHEIKPTSEFSMRPSGPARTCKACERERKAGDTRIDNEVRESLVMGGSKWTAKRFVNRLADIAGLEILADLILFAERKQRGEVDEDEDAMGLDL